MADNILKATISVQAPNVQATFAGVAAAANKTATSFKQLAPVTNQSTLALTNLGRVVQDAPFGFLGIANNLNPLLESFQRLRATSGSTSVALKALGSSLLGAGGLGFALSIVSTGLILFGDRIFGTGKKAKEAKTALDEYNDAVKGIFSSVAKEATEVLSLVAVLNSETETRQRKLAAIKELQQIQPEIFASLKLEGDTVIGLDNAYKNYIENLKTVIAAKIKQAQLDQKIEQLLKKQGVTLTESEKQWDGLINSLKNFRLEQERAAGGNIIANQFKRDRLATETEIDTLNKDIEGLVSDLSELSKGISIKGGKPIVPKEIKTPKLRLKPDGIEIPTVEEMIVAEVRGRIKDAKNSLNNILTETIPIKVDLSLPSKSFQDLAASVRNASAATQAEFKSFANGINKSIASIQVEALAGLGAAIGTALGGGDLQSVFAEFGNVVGSGLQAIGKQLIELGATAALTQKALAFLFENPALAIGAGIALIAAGAALKTSLSKGVATHRLGGGLVQAGRIFEVNENGKEFFIPNTGGMIVPNNQAAGGVGVGGGKIEVHGRLVASGNDLIAVFANASRSQGRLS